MKLTDKSSVKSVNLFLILAAAYRLRPGRRTRPVPPASESANSD